MSESGLHLLGVGAWLSVGLSCTPLDPFHTNFEAVEEAVYYEAKPKKSAPSEVSQLLVMTWNIKFAGARLRFFWECSGERSLMSKAEVVANLERLAAKIKQVQPDVLLLQEVDVESKRCAYVDQVQWLLDHTHLNYGAYASQWQADFIPSDGIGRMDSGNAILSRWPIEDAERLALPLIGDQDALTRYFYLRRNMLRVLLTVPGRASVFGVNIHTEAFAEDDTKKKHIDLFYQLLAEIDAGGGALVAGGDLNSIPPGSLQTRDYADDCADARFDNDDYGGQLTWLDPLYADFLPAIPLADYRADNSPYFSFTGEESTGWLRTLDYLFTNRQFLPGSGLVHQSTLQGGFETLGLSDHAPVTAVLVAP